MQVQRVVDIRGGEGDAFLSALARRGNVSDLGVLADNVSRGVLVLNDLFRRGAFEQVEQAIEHSGAPFL